MLSIANSELAFTAPSVHLGRITLLPARSKTPRIFSNIHHSIKDEMASFLTDGFEGGLKASPNFLEEAKTTINCSGSVSIWNLNLPLDEGRNEGEVEKGHR